MRGPPNGDGREKKRRQKMLGWMRKQTKSWFVYIAFGIIIVVFIFLYGFPQEGQREGVFVAQVNNQKITRRQYNELYENMLMFSRNLYKRSLTEEEIKQLKIKALDNLVEQTLVVQEAVRLGHEVSPEEVKREIANTPHFQTDGVFNKEIYLPIKFFVIKLFAVDRYFKRPKEVISFILSCKVVGL